MHFLSPALLLWAWLIIPLVLLFLVHRRPRRIRVSTLLFFPSPSAVSRKSPGLRRLRRFLAAALAAATLLLLVGAWSHPVVAPQGDGLRTVVILVDTSASMGAQDAAGRSGLARARALLRERLAGVPAGVGIALLRYDVRPELVLPPGSERRALKHAMDDLAVRPVEGDPQTALEWAQHLAARHAPATIWHVTDGGGLAAAASEQRPSLPGGLPANVTRETLDVGLPRPRNAGITACSVRARPLENGRFDAFVEVCASLGQPAATTLEGELDGHRFFSQVLALEAGGRQRLVIPVEAAEGALLSLRLHTEGDVLAEDDTLLARIPPQRARRLLWVRAAKDADPFTALALSALAQDGVLEVQESEPATYAEREASFDVLVFDGWLPDTWPPDRPVLMLQPPGSRGPVRAYPIAGAGLPTSGLRVIDESHPVLLGVASPRLGVTQTAVLEAAMNLPPLWVGERGPLLVAGTVAGQRLVIMAFAPARSESLGLTAAYPLLLSNAISWLEQDDAAPQAGDTRRTGTVIDTGGTPLRWLDSRNAARPGSQAPQGPVAELDRQGLWQTGEVQGAAALLSCTETRLPLGPEAASAGPVSESGLLHGDLRPLFVWLAIFLLLLEAWLFHRHALA